MSDTERAKINIDEYLFFFKRFHTFLGGSLFTGTLLISLINNNWASMFMILYPLTAYSYMISRVTLLYNKMPRSQKLASYITAGFLFLMAVFIGMRGLKDYKSSSLILNKDILEIKGSYGITIRKQDILSNQLVDSLPPISYKTNGFAGGDYAKGSFKVKNGKTVRLFVNKKQHPFLLLITINGDIYYNSDEMNMAELNKKLMQWREIH